MSATIPAWRDDTPTGYRWNPDKKRMEFWACSDKWLKSAYRTSANAMSLGFVTIVSYDDTWAEPVEP